MLLGVVEENRKKEVLDNLGVCAQLVENIKKQLAEIEGKPANICFEKKEKKKTTTKLESLRPRPHEDDCKRKR